MSKKIVSYTFETLPPISEERWEEMKRLAERPDCEIDTSDIPEITAEQIRQGVRGFENHPGLARNRRRQAA